MVLRTIATAVATRATEEFFALLLLMSIAAVFVISVIQLWFQLAADSKANVERVQILKNIDAALDEIVAQREIVNKRLEAIENKIGVP